MAWAARGEEGEGRGGGRREGQVVVRRGARGPARRARGAEDVLAPGDGGGAAVPVDVRGLSRARRRHRRRRRRRAHRRLPGRGVPPHHPLGQRVQRPGRRRAHRCMRAPRDPPTRDPIAPLVRPLVRPPRPPPSSAPLSVSTTSLVSLLLFSSSSRSRARRYRLCFAISSWWRPPHPNQTHPKPRSNPQLQRTPVKTPARLTPTSRPPHAHLTPTSRCASFWHA